MTFNLQAGIDYCVVVYDDAFGPPQKSLLLVDKDGGTISINNKREINQFLANLPDSYQVFVDDIKFWLFDGELPLNTEKIVHYSRG